jgi:hypothetical protein
MRVVIYFNTSMILSAVSITSPLIAIGISAAEKNDGTRYGNELVFGFCAAISAASAVGALVYHIVGVNHIKLAGKALDIQFSKNTVGLAIKF